MLTFSKCQLCPWQPLNHRGCCCCYPGVPSRCQNSGIQGVLHITRDWLLIYCVVLRQRLTAPTLSFSWICLIVYLVLVWQTVNCCWVLRVFVCSLWSKVITVWSESFGAAAYKTHKRCLNHGQKLLVVEALFNRLFSVHWDRMVQIKQKWKSCCELMLITR